MIWFVVLITIILGIVTILQLRAYRKLKDQTKLIHIQSREIQKQLRELEEQNKVLNELNAEKQQVISVVSHDLKGPFNRIFALMQLITLSGDNLTEDQKEYLGKIHQIVADGLSMIRNLLDNRRLDEKGIELMPEKVNVSILISLLVKNYRILGEKKKIQVLLEAPGQINIVADKLYLTRAIENLISNALKFSPPESTIRVSVNEKQEWVEIGVKDEGPGISREDQKKLFQKYNRLSARPTGGESSTGLGLYIMKTIIDKMNGEIVCESEEGKGANFIVRLRKF